MAGAPRRAVLLAVVGIVVTASSLACGGFAILESGSAAAVGVHVETVHTWLETGQRRRQDHTVRRFFYHDRPAYRAIANGRDGMHGHGILR